MSLAVVWKEASTLFFSFMKKIILILAILSGFCLEAQAQKAEKLERKFVGAAGKSNTSPSGKLKVSYSIGGIMTATGRGRSKKFTQGFQQPECSDCDTTVNRPSLSCDNLYNIITPNQDGKNDQWIVEQLINPEPGLSADLKIYTRWGQEVFSAVNYQNDWAGQDKNNRPLPSGTYYYLLIYDEDQKPCKGDITLLKN